MAICNIVAVKSVNPGGRLFSAVDVAEIRKNGQIGKLGAYEPVGQSTIKKFEKIRNADITTTVPIGIVMQPEMMYDNSRMSLQKLDLFEISINDPFVFVPLEEGDKFEITGDLIAGGQAAQTQVGHALTLTDNSVLYTRADNANGVALNGRYFEVIGIKESHARKPYVGGALKDVNVQKMYTVELKIKRA